MATFTALMPGAFPGKEQVEDASLPVDPSQQHEAWKRYESEEEEISDPESNSRCLSYSPIEPDDNGFDLSDYESMSDGEEDDDAQMLPERGSENGRIASAIRVPRSRPVSVVTIKHNSVPGFMPEDLMAESSIPSSPTSFADGSLDRISIINPRLDAILQDEGIDLEMEILEATSVMYVAPSTRPILVSIDKSPSKSPWSSRGVRGSRRRKTGSDLVSDGASIRKRSSIVVSQSDTVLPEKYRRLSKLYLQSPLNSEAALQLLLSEQDNYRSKFTGSKDSLLASEARYIGDSTNQVIADNATDRGRKRSETTIDTAGAALHHSLRRVDRRIRQSPVLTVYEPEFPSHSVERTEKVRSRSCNRFHPTSDNDTTTDLLDQIDTISPIRLDRLWDENPALGGTEEGDTTKNVDSALGSDRDTTFSGRMQGSFYTHISSSAQGHSTNHPYRHQYQWSGTTLVSMLSNPADVKPDMGVGKPETTTAQLPKLRRTLKNFRLRLL